MPRARLNDLAPAEQQALAAALLGGINDQLLDQLNEPRPQEPFPDFVARCRAIAGWGDLILQGAGLPGLPTWRSDEPIPPAWLAVKPADDGTPRPPVATATPNLPPHPDFRTPRYANVIRASSVENRLFGQAAQWLGAIQAVLVPGIADATTRFAAPILWCWCAWIAEANETPVDYSGFPVLEDCDELLCFPNTDGTLQLFAVAIGDVAIWTIRQPLAGSDWGPWTKLADELQQVAVAPQRDGRLQVFAVSPLPDTRAVYTCWQEGAGWTGMQKISRPLDYGLEFYGAARSDGDRLDLFAVSGVGKIWNLWQNPDRSTWGDWGEVGGAGIVTPSFTVTHVADNTVIVLHIGSDGQVWALTQYPGGYCQDPYPIQALGNVGHPVRYIASSWNSGGKLAVLAVQDTDLYVCFSNEFDGHWEPFAKVATNVRSRPCLVLAPDQRLRMFYTVEDGGAPRTFYRWQLSPGAREWSEPQAVPFEHGLLKMTAEVDVAGRVHLFGLATTASKSDIFHAVERARGGLLMLPVEAFY